MMTVYWLSCFLTLPGAVLRAFLEHLCLKAQHMSVEDVNYLQHNELCGHVEHKPVRTLGKGCALCFVPSLLCLLFGLVFWCTAILQICYMGITPVSVEKDEVSVMYWICVALCYLGVCCLSHVFPTYEDALYLLDAYSEANTAVKILLFLPVQATRGGAYLARFGVWPFVWIVLSVCLIVF